MSTENFLLAFGACRPCGAFAAALGWIGIPLMNANMDVLFRTRIPVEMQGRVYAARNTLHFFTIPLGYLAGGFLVDSVFEPFMAAQPAGSLLSALFGAEKGAGAALLFLTIGFLGVFTCLFSAAGRASGRLSKAPPPEKANRFTKRIKYPGPPRAAKLREAVPVFSARYTYFSAINPPIFLFSIHHAPFLLCLLP